MTVPGLLTAAGLQPRVSQGDEVRAVCFEVVASGAEECLCMPVSFNKNRGFGVYCQKNRPQLENQYDISTVLFRLLGKSVTWE